MLPIWAIWLILCGIFLLVEIFTISFLMFWPGIGAFLAFLVAVIGATFPVQLGVFAVSSTLMIIFMKPLVQKLFKTKDVPMNNKSIIGKTGIVVKEIDSTHSSTGQVKVSGELWSAFCEEKCVLTEGTDIIVEDLDGVKLKVKKLEK